MSYFLVFVGGGLGSLSRYLISRLFTSTIVEFPVATFLSNAISSAILGLLLGYFFQKHQPDESLRLLIAVGFCGGFSTFSTFSYETFMLMNYGNYKTAFVNIFLNLLICYVAVGAGFFIGKN